MISLITNIKELLQVRDEGIIKVSGLEMKILPTIKNAFLLIEDDLISDYGKMQNLPKLNPDVIIDAQDKIVLPTWCDSHTHIVYAGNREQEFIDRINGLTYEEIANRGDVTLDQALDEINMTRADLKLDLNSLLESQFDQFKQELANLNITEELSNSIKNGLDVANNFAQAAELLNLIDNDSP